MGISSAYPWWLNGGNSCIGAICSLNQFLNGFVKYWHADSNDPLFMV